MLIPEDEIDHQRLHHEFEQSITSINRSLISAVTGAITKAAFINVVKMVACLRARYLHSVLDLGKDCHSECIPTDAALELKRLREAYTEAMDGFAALEHAVKRGYVHLVD